MKHLKQLLLIAIFFAVGLTSFAQVGIGTVTPNASAALDLESTTKGFLPPRMSKAQLDAMSSVPEGLLVFCTDCRPKGLYLFDGLDFVALANAAIVTLDAGSLATTDTTPPLSGTVNQATSVVVVTVNSIEYIAVNNGNGTWSLPDNTLPALSVSTHVVTVKVTNASGSSATVTGDLVIS